MTNQRGRKVHIVEWALLLLLLAFAGYFILVQRGALPGNDLKKKQERLEEKNDSLESIIQEKERENINLKQRVEKLRDSFLFKEKQIDSLNKEYYEKFYQRVKNERYINADPDKLDSFWNSTRFQRYSGDTIRYGPDGNPKR